MLRRQRCGCFGGIGLMRALADTGHAGRSGKVGVLTFHRCFNYGSYWQARCLVEGLRAAGHDAELLDHEDAAVERAEARCLLQPTLPLRSPRADLPAYKAKGRRFVEAVGALPRSARFPLDAPHAAGYRAVVIGSDEVWNFRHPWYGGAPIFFGDGIAADRLVAYAASFGNHDAADGVRGDYAARLGSFASLSVRDANSHALVRAATGAEPAMVLDPCLQFPDPARRAPRGGEAPYALVYGHGFPGWFGARVAAWARGAGLRLVSIGYRNDFAGEQRLDAGPLDFAEAMAGAAAVVTNFFHGCVFALLNDTPLVSVPTPYRFNKVRDLTGLLGCEERLIGEATPTATIAALLATPPGPAVQARIAALRAQSNDYLRAALG